MSLFRNEHKEYKYCPMCFRGNGTAVFLEESFSVEYQDTIICYECLCYKKTKFINEYPGTKSKNYDYLSKEELVYWEEAVRRFRGKDND